MKKKVGFGLRMALALALCSGICLFSLTEAAAAAVTALEGVSFATGESLADNLKVFSGKDVVVHLRSGKSVQGYVKAVGNALLHLEKLSGRDFYDALIRIDDISAVEAKFRDMK